MEGDEGRQLCWKATDRISGVSLQRCLGELLGCCPPSSPSLLPSLPPSLARSLSLALSLSLSHSLSLSPSLSLSSTLLYSTLLYFIHTHTHIR